MSIDIYMHILYISLSNYIYVYIYLYIVLKQDNRNLNQTVENMKIIANEKETIRKLLLGKESDIEKKTREITQLTKVNNFKN